MPGRRKRRRFSQAAFSMGVLISYWNLSIRYF
jgi:hypothetical protein